jgi:Tfp pilus assembly protein PilF
MSHDYDHGQRDGLRLALTLLAAEEEKWAALLGESRSGRTNLNREIRHKALQVAQKRIQTALNRMMPKDGAQASAELTSALDKLGL